MRRQASRADFAEDESCSTSVVPQRRPSQIIVTEKTVRGWIDEYQREKGFAYSIC